MLNITATGCLFGDAVLKTERVRCLEFTLVTFRKGFGQYAGKVFKDKAKVIVYGRDIETMKDWLTAGAWVEVIGEPKAEAWVDRVRKDKAYGRIVITARTVTACIFSDSQGEQEQAATEEPAPTKPTGESDAVAPEDDDVPF